MNLEFFIAKKVAASGSKSFSRLIIRIAILAIALSLTVMIVATALITGFKNEITSKIFGFWGHIHIMDTNVNRSFEALPIEMEQDFYLHLDTISKIKYVDRARILGFPIQDRLVQRETRGGVRHIQVTALVPGIIKTNEAIEGIILKGVGEDFDWSYMKEYLLEGEASTVGDSSQSRKILISKETSQRLDLALGSRIILVFVKDGRQKPRRFEVGGIYKTGLEEYDREFAIVGIEHLQEVLDWKPNQVGGFEVFIDDIADLNPLTEHIYLDHLPNTLYCESIRDKLPGIFEWLGLQDINEVVILLLVLLVAVINMVTALLILILERTNMIGVLKAMGQSNWSIQKIFLYHAAYIIAIGLLLGNMLGLFLCYIQDRFELIKLSEADYYLSVAPIDLNLWTVLFLNIGTALITLVFLIIPSYLVSHISPVKAIRFK